MSLLDTIESRFTGIEEHVVTDVEKAAHSQIAQALIAAGKVILPMLPEGGEVELVLQKLQEAEHWAHVALAGVSSAATTVSTVASDVATEASKVGAEVPGAAAADASASSASGTSAPASGAPAPSSGTPAA